MNYTAHQQEAIEARGEDLLISAAAGSGKTRVLVDRIVHMMVHDGVPLAAMLIVTFTNAAAGEMRARLRQGLQDAVAAAEEEEAKAFLIAQLEDLPDAHISTMHAFCISELRRFYHVLALDPNFKILPETTTTILREDALEEAMDDAYAEGDEAFLNLVAAYGGRNNDETLRDLVRSVYNRIQAHAEPLVWLENQVAGYGEPTSQSALAVLREVVDESCQTADALCAEMRQLAAMLPNADKLYDMISDDEAIVRGLRHCLETNDAVNAMMAYLPGITWTTKPRKAKNATEEELEIDDALAALRKELKDTVGDLSALAVEGGSARIATDRQLVLPHLEAFAALVRRYDAAYREAKQARSGLDFNDLEHDMLRLLQDEEACAAIRQEVQYIFFDEYQDANPIQEAIVEALAHPGHLFFVGDVKQAIYRFRRADPNIFNRRYARYRDSEDGRLIFLSENFRSRAEILNFSNALFETLMTPALGEVDYREPGQALVCGGSFEADADAVQCVAIETDASTHADREAEWIAAEIERLVAAGRYDYGDIVVLMRSPRSRLHGFEDVFKAHHIPYYSDNSVVGFENLEVRLFIAMLTVLSNDTLDTALLSALLSPFGGLTDAELATIRLTAPEGTFSAACKDYLTDHEDRITNKLRRFYEHVSAWRAALHYESLTDVALRLFEESGYGAFLLGMDDGVERQQNVLAFIDTISEYERAHRYGLPGFLHYVQTLKARNMDSSSPGIGLNENDRCVRIMSIHKSKGLGFKVVFLADMARTFNLRDNRPAIVVDDQLGVAMNVVDLEHATTHHSFEKKLLAAKNRRETLSEEVRLLYVALTRAIDRLYLVSTLKPKEVEKWQKRRGHARADVNGFRGVSSYRDWLGLCLCDPHHRLSLDASQPLYEWQYLGLDDSLDAEEASTTPAYRQLLDEADPTLTAELGACFHHEYAYQEATTMPFKKTVSQIAKSNHVLPDHIKPWPAYAESAVVKQADVPVPPFIQEHLSFTGAAMGTLMHQVVQWLPLQLQDRGTIEAALDALQARALLTAEERAAVDVDMLETFYQSDFVQRIMREGIHIEHEMSFTMHLDDYMVDGQIDLFFETKDGYEIVDFKTDRSMNADRYRKQLVLYAQALQAARGKPVTHRWLYWLRFQQAEEV
ncbi:MAG: helicase-exonuclease AddAB subunit AddA [Peptococcaceae bacterium]|nr:helicase-exonuclease AddAB subunit AddA [Peptococcaceae bacterium]